MNVFTPQDMRFYPPTFGAATITDKVEDEYGLTGEWEALVGERDQNFRLNTKNGRKYVVKMDVDADPDVIEERMGAYAKLEIIFDLDHNLVVERLRAACGV